MMDQYSDKILFLKRGEFFARDIEAICGVKRARLQTWLERNWIVPSIHKAQGSGENNIFSAIDLVTISVFRRCVENGMFRSTVAYFLSDLEQRLKVRNFEPGWQDGNPLFIFFLRKDGEVIDAQIRNYSGVSGLDFTVASASEADDMIAVNLSKICRTIKLKLKE
jgi:hypothetical protein